MKKILPWKNIFSPKFQESQDSIEIFFPCGVVGRAVDFRPKGPRFDPLWDSCKFDKGNF